MRHLHRTGAVAAAGVIGLLAASLAPAAAAHDGPEPHPSDRRCERRVNNTYDRLLECVTLEGVRRHQAALQDLADASTDPVYPGSRAAGTEGYAASVGYVVGLLRDAGYQVTLDPFEFSFSFPATLEQLTPVQESYETGPFTGSGSGDVTGAVVPVDLALDPPRASTSGCDAEDFTGLDFSGPADIALIQRGACTFATKAINAEAAGAEAVVIFNQGNDPTREDLIVGTLGGVDVVGIPVVGASFAQGVALSQAGSTARVKVLPNETRTSVNVIADLPGRNPDNVVMAGAHLDGVSAGPGINDNGSGSAAILETALRMARLKPQNSIRFAWWGAEELGLIGSQAYVDGLPQEERDKIALYMNYDMIGSPNYIFGVYDADQSTFEAPVVIPEGSTAIEDVYESYYTSVGEPYDDTEFSGRSDYEAFILAGIPSGGLFTGAEVVKTERQQEIWGGTAGDQFDPCYHLACDTFDNINDHALDVNGDLVAYAMLTFAYSTETVNGVPGRHVPGRHSMPEPAGPQGTFAEGGGGLARDLDHEDPSD
jgi:Zn-dependent M28 family amino/carboxypeptidase